MSNKYNLRAWRLSLDNLVRERQWATFLTRFSQLVDKGGSLCEAIIQCRNYHTTHRTLLHSLCDISSDSSPPPPELIRAVASACPRSLLLHEPGYRTPLHVAIQQGASLGTIEALLDAADHDETLNKKDLLSAQDAKGQTPLLLAVRCGRDDCIVKYLVNQDDDGSTLLMSSLTKSKKKQHPVNVPLKYVASSESYYVGEGLESPQDLLRFMIVRTYYAKLKRRFPAFANEYERSNRGNGSQANPTINVDGACLLQAAVFCHDLIGSTKVASSIISQIIRNGLYHRERLDTRRDYAGNLTLHIACLSDTTRFDQVLRLGDRQSDYGLNSEDCTLLEYLIRANPPPCSSPYLSKNAEGHIPLHCAIESGKDWTQLQLLIDACPGSIQCCTSKGELPLHFAIKCGSPVSVVMNLWNRYPEAASLADGSTHLYPFQLAAVGVEKKSTRKGKSRKKNKSSESEDVVWDETSLSFFMLRECPSLLSTSLLHT